jgi:hypothetical protein
MKPVFRIEKILNHSKNMDLINVEKRVKIFGKIIITTKSETSLKPV